MFCRHVYLCLSQCSELLHVELFCRSVICFFIFFFFQAEDGIRDYKVTGVQTCALPISMIPYYHFAEGKVAGVQCFISRTGYTGEDGFELYCRGADLEKLWHALVGAGRARSEEHTSELHHLVISYAVFCLKKKKK